MVRVKPRYFGARTSRARGTMYFLKEKIRTITYQLEYTAAYALLLSKLKEWNFTIESADQHGGDIVVRCLSQLVNMGLWRCWSDKLLLQIKSVHPNMTSVSVYAIPNLWRIRSSEKVTDIESLLSQLAGLAGGRLNSP